MRSIVLICTVALMLAGCAGDHAVRDFSNAAAADAQANAEARASMLDRRSDGSAAAPDTMRWLFGSGEAAGASIQAYRALADYVVTAKAAQPSLSVTMGLLDARNGTGEPGCTTADGRRKPYAVVLDVDETVLLNRGYEYRQALEGGGWDAAAWDAWERGGAPYVAPVPGAVTGLRRIREAGITVIFNTNREARNAAGTEAAINQVDLGPARHGETLYLKGDDALGSRKDGRRAAIAAKWCVLALAGDNLGDFADLFNDDALSVAERRDRAARGPLARLWGAGWFALPNPVYGASIRGSIDDVFPPEARWNPEGAD